jgi:diguanylate cyclase (GGDEF)-like protein
MVLPYVPVSFGLVVTVTFVVRDGRLDPVLYLIGVAVMVLVMLRQFVALRDNQVLTRELLGRERQLAHLAFHDPLTGLANRALFYDRVGHAVLRQDRAGTPIGLLYIDLDCFKAVNDTLGHAAGDELLKAVAERLTDSLRASDTVARLGGDEFAVLTDPVDNVDDIVIVADRIVAAIGEAFPLSAGVARIGASVGHRHPHAARRRSRRLPATGGQRDVRGQGGRQGPQRPRRDARPKRLEPLTICAWAAVRTGRREAVRGDNGRVPRALLALPECVVVYRRSGDLTYVDDLSDREALLVRARPYLFGGTDRDCFTYSLPRSSETGWVVAPSSSRSPARPAA